MATFSNDFKVKHGLVVSTTATVLSIAQSTSTNSGALVVAGGAGIGGNLYVAGDLIVNGVDIFNYDADVWYVSDNTGDDVNHDGHRVQSAFKTVSKALSVATTGDTVYIEPGTYYETFPLTIPQGVAVRGAGLREVTLYPTTATNTQTAFLLNGETSISDFTVTGFYKPGYAFKFAEGAKITTRSPYIERFSVITRGSTTSSIDPYGFDAADAGNGAYLDAGVLDPTSLEPAMLWNEATFIVPNATGMYMTNGARAELLNGFFYFANKAIDAQVGTLGYGSVGKTKLRLSGISGGFTPGDSIIYKDTVGNTLASGIIYSTSTDYVYLTGPVYGFSTVYDRTAKIATTYGAASLSTGQKKFGSASLAVTGDSGYVEVTSDSDWQFGTNDYTVDAWVYSTSNTSTQYIYKKGSVAATTIDAYMNTSRNVVVNHGTVAITGSTTLSLNTWYHVRVVRRSATNGIYLYINGSLDASSTSATASVSNTDPFWIGNNFGVSNNYWHGYIDDLRVSTVARNTGTFTAPTSALTSDVSTILMLHFDGSNGSTSVIDDPIATQNVYSTGVSPATATRITLADYHQFGAELRCIGSAACFGNQGVIANGTGTDLKLIAFNMSFVGSGKDLSDDATLTVQSNEVIQTNGGKIYYQTVDQSGDFRVGDAFLVNQRTGNVSFGNATVDIANLSSLTISNGVDSTILTPGNILVGNINLASNTIGTVSGNLTISPSGGLVTINNQLTVNGTISGGDIYSNGQLVLTSGGGGGGYVGTITAGTDTAVSTSTGAVSIWNTSTLQSVTNRGSTTDNAISITNTTIATNTTSGALQVIGGVGVQGTVHAAGGNPDQSYELYSPKVTLSTTAPSTATNKIGDFWIDTGSGIEYQWIKDGANYYWVQFVGI